MLYIMKTGMMMFVVLMMLKMAMLIMFMVFMQVSMAMVMVMVIQAFFFTAIHSYSKAGAADAAFFSWCGGNSCAGYI